MRLICVLLLWFAAAVSGDAGWLDGNWEFFQNDFYGGKFTYLVRRIWLKS